MVWIPASASFLATVVLIGLGILLPLALLTHTAQLGSFRPDVALAWLILLYASLRLSWCSLQGGPRVLSLTFWVFVYVWLGLAPLAQLAAGEFPLRGYYATSTVVRTQGMVILGLVAFEAGRQLAGRVSVRTGLLEVLLTRQVLIRRVVIAAIGSALLSVFLVTALGGPTSLFAAREEMDGRIRSLLPSDEKAPFLLFVTLLRVPIFVTMFLLICLLARHSASVTRRQRISIALLTVVLALLNLAVSNPVNAARYWVGTMVLGLLFALVPWRRHTFVAVATLALVLLLTFVFPYLDIFRHSLVPRAAAFRDSPLVRKTDYDAFQQLLNTREHVDTHGVAYGRQVVGTLFFWIPRRLWENKPVASGELVAEASGYRFTNLSLPLWGEALLDGGLLAIIAVFLVYGAVQARLEQLLVQPRSGGFGFAQVAVPIVAAYQVFLLRGALMSAFAYLVPIVAVLWLCTGRGFPGSSNEPDATEAESGICLPT